MKNIITLLLFVLSVSLQAQIPDSLNVILPWASINVEDCMQDVGEKPTTTNENVVISEPEEFIIEDDDGNCVKKLLTYTILDWSSGNVYEFIQIVRTNSQFSIDCKSEVSLAYSELPLYLTPEDLVENPIPDHEYSFDPNDLTNTQLDFINPNSAGGNHKVFVYDHTGMTVCDVDIYVTDCEEDIVIDIPETATIVFDGEYFIPASAALFDINVVYPCASHIVQVSYGSANGFFSTNIGKTVEVDVKILIAGGQQISETILVSLEGVGPPPIPMFIEEKSFEAGETVTFDIWSDDVVGLIAWQFRLTFLDAKILSIDEGDLFDNIPHNILDGENPINTIWSSANGYPIEYIPGTTWFTLTVEVEKSGSTFDLFDTTNDPWSSIVLEDDDGIVEYETNFIFNVAPRNILSDVQTINDSDISLVSNLVTSEIALQGLDSDDYQIVIFNATGDAIMKQTVNPNSSMIAIETIPSGAFFLNVSNHKMNTTFRFVKM